MTPPPFLLTRSSAGAPQNPEGTCRTRPSCPTGCYRATESPRQRVPGPLLHHFLTTWSAEQLRRSPRTAAPLWPAAVSASPPVARPGASSLGLVGRVSGPRLSARSLPPAAAPSGLARRPRAPQFRRHCQAWRLDLGAPHGPCPGGRASPVPEGWPSSGPYPRDQGQETCRRHRADQSPGGRAATWSCVPRWAPDGLPPPGSGGQRVSGERLDFRSDRDEDPGAFSGSPPRSLQPPQQIPTGHLPSGDVADPVGPQLSRDGSGQCRSSVRKPAQPDAAGSCSHPPHRLTHGTHTARTHHA